MSLIRSVSGEAVNVSNQIFAISFSASENRQLPIKTKVTSNMSECMQARSIFDVNISGVSEARLTWKIFGLSFFQYAGT